MKVERYYSTLRKYRIYKANVENLNHTTVFILHVYHIEKLSHESSDVMPRNKWLWLAPVFTTFFDIIS
jgi:hypothetical protein